MVWDFVLLKQMIETVYAVLVSQPDMLLRMYKHCGKAFMQRMAEANFAKASAGTSIMSISLERKKRTANSFYFLLLCGYI